MTSDLTARALLTGLACSVALVVALVLHYFGPHLQNLPGMP